ncbi:hypothetical protein D3C75_1083420 [compost metagenome]
MAPRVVSPFQYIAMSSTGKLAEAAMPNVRPTKNAMFTCSNRMPSAIASTPRATTAARETSISRASLATPRLMTMA